MIRFHTDSRMWLVGINLGWIGYPLYEIGFYFGPFQLIVQYRRNDT